MCAGVSLFPLMNAMMKLLTVRYPVLEIVWARFTGHLIVMLVIFLPRHGRRLIATRRPLVQIGRSALMLGSKFSVLTQWDGWIPLYKKGCQEYGLSAFLASIRSINVPPDVSNLLGGKEEVVFPKLRDAGLQCIEDGAEVICLGSTTMHQSHAYLTENLPVPVINPGPLTYKLAEAMLGLGLTHSRKAYPKPNVPKLAMIHATMDAAAASERVSP